MTKRMTTKRKKPEPYDEVVYEFTATVRVLARVTPSAVYPIRSTVDLCDVNEDSLVGSWFYEDGPGASREVSTAELTRLLYGEEGSTPSINWAGHSFHPDFALRQGDSDV